MTRTMRLLLGMAGTCLVARPVAVRAQNTAPTSQSKAVADTSATTILARAAIQKFFPAVLSDTANPGTLFIIVNSEGQLLNATHGTLADNDKLKAKYEEFDSKVESMAVKSVPAGALLPRALQVVITTFKP